MLWKTEWGESIPREWTCLLRKCPKILSPNYNFVSNQCRSRRVPVTCIRIRCNIPGSFWTQQVGNWRQRQPGPGVEDQQKEGLFIKASRLGLKPCDQSLFSHWVPPDTGLPPQGTCMSMPLTSSGRFRKNFPEVFTSTPSTKRQLHSTHYHTICLNAWSLILAEYLEDKVGSFCISISPAPQTLPEWVNGGEKAPPTPRTSIIYRQLTCHHAARLKAPQQCIQHWAPPTPKDSTIHRQDSNLAHPALLRLKDKISTYSDFTLRNLGLLRH
jgi:hypothetical protein